MGDSEIVRLQSQVMSADPQARRRCCSLLTYSPAWLGLRTQFSSLAPGQRAWGPAAKCEFISAQALR